MIMMKSRSIMMRDIHCMCKDLTQHAHNFDVNIETMLIQRLNVVSMLTLNTEGESLTDRIKKYLFFFKGKFSRSDLRNTFLCCSNE